MSLPGPEMESGQVGSERTLPELEEVSPNPTRNHGLIRKPDSAVRRRVIRKPAESLRPFGAEKSSFEKYARMKKIIS